MAAGVDLGGTKIQTVVLRDGEVAGSSRVRTPGTGSPRDVIEAIVGTIRTSLEQASVGESDLEAVGVASPGEIDQAEGAVLLAANVPGFSERVDLGPLISEELGGVDVTIDNDVRVGVLGEYRQGAGRPYKDVLGCGSGPASEGGGLILDGELRGRLMTVVVYPCLSSSCCALRRARSTRSRSMLRLKPCSQPSRRCA